MKTVVAIRGRLFIILSTSVRNVDKPSSVNILSLTIDLNAFFVILTMVSIAIPIYAAGELNFHLIHL